MTLLISSQEEVDELQEGLSQFNEKRVHLEQYSLPSEYEIAHIHFSPGIGMECSLCRVGVGCHPDGDWFYEQVGFLTTVKVKLKGKQDIFALRKVLLCRSCLDRLERPVVGKTPKLTLITTTSLL